MGAQAGIICPTLICYITLSTLLSQAEPNQAGLCRPGYVFAIVAGTGQCEKKTSQYGLCRHKSVKMVRDLLVVSLLLSNLWATLCASEPMFNPHMSFQVGDQGLQSSLWGKRTEFWTHTHTHTTERERGVSRSQHTLALAGSITILQI